MKPGDNSTNNSENQLDTILLSTKQPVIETKQPDAKRMRFSSLNQNKNDYDDDDDEENKNNNSDDDDDDDDDEADSADGAENFAADEDVNSNDF